MTDKISLTIKKALNEVVNGSGTSNSNTATLKKMRFIANVNKRGFSKMEAQAKIESEMIDFTKYILPYSRFAHMNINVDINYKHEVIR